MAAFLLTTIIHECAHALAGMLFNSQPVLHHHYVEHLAVEHLSIFQQVDIALAGPIASLLQGLIFGWIFIKSKGRKLLQLFFLWFAVLGLSNALGYLMTGPIFQQGDIGRVYYLLDAALWLQLSLALLGALLLLYLAYKLTTPFLTFCPEKEMVSNPDSRVNFSFYILILPWIIGSGVMTILYLPIVAIVSIIYPIMSGMVFIFPWQNARRIEEVQVNSNQQICKPSIPAIIFLVLLIIIFKIVLAPGIAL